ARDFQPAERSFLVGSDQARIAGDIGREDRREPTFDASWPAGLHRTSSVADDPTPASALRALSLCPSRLSVGSPVSRSSRSRLPCSIRTISATSSLIR